MAVEIPVVVDIEKAFQDAAKQVPNAIAPLEKQISKRQLNVSVDVGTGMKRFKEILKDSNISVAELEKALEAVNVQIRTLQGSGGFIPGKALKTSERDLLALRAALETKLEAGSFIDTSVDKIKAISSGATTAGKAATTAIRATNEGLTRQNGLLSGLIGRISAYTAVFAGLRLIKNIRETTAEFEMQKVALGGIIQDATRANQLFAQIKAAAVESPFEIKDLVSFTKQLSAYRIETDKLFDVTMRLADVSAGLGVDMSRLVLAYGQVRAASVLRGQELRQFTEAGIPLVDLLAKKFTQLRGELVSTGEVFDLISKRAVPFAMIEEIFNDMTDAGGIFYQMQLKQSETLKGQWMKLKDVISIAYDEMGRTALVSEAMSGWIRLISSLLKSWERIASVVNVAVWSYIAYKAAVKGIIPLYNMQQKAVERQIILEKQQQIEQIKLAAKTNQLTKADQRRIAQIRQMTAEDLKRIYAMDRMSQSQAMMFFWRNKDNKEIVKAITQTGILTKAQQNAIRNMNAWQLRIKVWGSSIRTLFKSITTAIASFWPIAAVSALTSTIIGLVQAHQEQTRAIQKVDKAYHEQEQALQTVENAYRKIQEAIKGISDEQERAAKEAASFGQKLAYAQKIIDMLKKFGMGGDFDLSLLNTENIDDFVDTWFTQLENANELTRDWGRNVAQVANAWEASLLGIHFAGDNLNTDIKQLTNAYVKLTGNKAYRENITDMRNYVDSLSVYYKEYYDNLTKVLGEDAKLAIAQKRRNETEYQYQMRLIKNYETIRNFAASNTLAFTKAAHSFKPMNDMLVNFESRLNEVEREFDKTWGAMEGKDELTIKMAIDKMFAENQWEDWLKEAWIERVNGKYQMNIQMTPTIAQVNVPKGMKGIIATEFEGLFTEQELQNMNSVTEIGKAIEKKMKDAATAIAEAEAQANNLANNDLWASKSKEKIQKAQLTIESELAKAEKDRNQDVINDAIARIDAITKENAAYDEQIRKKKESAKAEYELAKAARERLLNEGLSDMGKDIKQAFPDLMKDVYREATDENYVSRFLISDDDLAKIKDGVDAYDLWAKQTKAIADEREKMAGAGVTEATVAAEQTRLDAQRLEIEKKLSEINEEIADWNYEEVKAQYDNLRLAVQQAATKEARVKAEAELAKFIATTNFDEKAVLAVEKQRLVVQLGITNAALGAQNAIANTFQAMDDAGKFWEEFGKRYNFTLRDKGKGGSGQDPWILLFKNRMNFMQDFQKGVEDLDKYLVHSAALSREQAIMKGRGLSVGIKTEELLGSPEELKNWYQEAIDKVVAKIQELGGRQFAGLGVTEILAKDLSGKKLQKYQELLQELWKGLTDFDTNQIKKNFEDKLKEVSDELKRSETARNFYNNILNLTGDEDLAQTMSVSVYGGIGDEFKQRMQTQLNSALETLKAEGPVSADLEKAFKEMDFEKILGFDGLPEKVEKVVREAYESTQKYSAEQIKTWLKELEKFETYGEKRVQLAKQTAQKIAEINASSIPEAQKTSLITQYQRKEAEQVAKLQYEAFKDSPMYVDMFENLEAASMKMLTNMRDRLIGLKEQWKDLDPMQLREMQRRIKEIDTQIAAKNPFKTLIEGFKQYRDLARTGTRAGADFAAITAEQNRAAQVEQLEVVSKQYQVAKDEYQQALETYGVNSQITDEKKVAYDTAKAVLSAQQAVTDEAKIEADEAQRAANKWQEAGDAILKGAVGLQKWSGYISDALGGIQEIVDVFATDDFADTFGIIAGGIEKTVSGATDMATGVGRALSGDVIGGTAQAIKGLGSMISGIFGTGQQLKIKRINKQIEEQDRLINAMEHSYDRLGKAMEDAFGSDYIYNYNKQLEALRAQMEAYQKQAQLESQKGKKKDKKKIEEYNNAARDAQDQITDMEGMLAEFMSGTDLTSAAKDFAESWIEAYKEFGSTTDAMKKKFQDMVENMVVNSLAAQLIQSVLRPVFDAIDTASKDGELTAQEIGDISAMLPERMEMIDASMNNMMNELLAAGVNLRDQAGSMTGISRDIAGASEESILGLTAGINTQNFYMQHIDMNVAMILAALTGGTTTAGSGTTGEYVDPYKDQMLAYVGTLPQMRDEMASIRAMLERVIRPVGAAATYYVSARM